MRVAVRYYSRSGNTKDVADVIAKAAGVEAISVDAEDAAISEPVDLLFIGGALYAYGLDNHLKDYLATLKKEDVKKAAVFSTSWLSKHAIDLIKKGLADAGIPTEKEALHLKSNQVSNKLSKAEEFAKKYL